MQKISMVVDFQEQIVKTCGDKKILFWKWPQANPNPNPKLTLGLELGLTLGKTISAENLKPNAKE